MKQILKTLLPDFYRGADYKLLCMITGRGNTSYAFAKIIKRFISRGYYPNILRDTACLMFNPFTVPLLVTSDGPSGRLHDGQFLKVLGTESA